MKIPFEKDTLQKLSLIAFAEAILLMMGDTREVVRFHSTELIIPTFRHRFLDGVLELADGTLINIEFQTGNLTEAFLLRCAQYAINLRVISKRLVETNIISTGLRNQSKLTALISKFFPFKPKIFFYSELDGLEKLINIKTKIENKEKLTLLDKYNLVFIPFMGNVDGVNAAFEVFQIANNGELFEKDEQSEIKKCQFIVALIISDNDEELFNEFWRIIMMNNSFLDKYEENLLKENTDFVTRKVTDDVTKRVTEDVTRKVTDDVTRKVTDDVTRKVTDDVTRKVTEGIAKSLKDVLDDVEIAKHTGLPIQKVKNL